MGLLEEGKKVVVAWAEDVRGSGYRNQIIWYLTRSDTGRLEVHAIQPDEQTEAMRVLFSTAAVCTKDLTAEVRALKE